MSTTRYNYWCQNCNCGASGANRNFQITKDDSEKDVLEYCPNHELSDPMKLMGEASFGGIGKFQSMTPIQRQEVLKKRSHEHFNREIREKRTHMLKHDNG